MKLILVTKRPETDDVMSFMFRSAAPLGWQAARDSDHNNARALRHLVAERLRRRGARGSATTR